MSVGYQVLQRGGRDAGGQLEGKVVILEEMADTGEPESESEAERSRNDDVQSLIDKDPELDEETGEARDYEVALKYTGFGLFHALLMCVNGVALLSDVMELLSVAFVLRILQQKDEFGTTDAENAILSSVVFVGMLCGSYTWGGLADVLGRRFVLIVAFIVNGIFGAVSALSPNISVFILCRFLSGVGVGGSLPVIFPYIAELTLNKYRGSYMSLQTFFWTVGRMLCGGVAWVVLPLHIPQFHSWRLFILLSSVPAFLGAFLYFLLPESPRYLLEHGQEGKALRNLRLVHKLNHLHKRQTQFPIKSIRVDAVHANDVGGAKGVASGAFSRWWVRAKGHLVQLFSHTKELYSRTYCRQTVLMSTILFTLAFGSYGVMLWFPSYVEQVTIAENERHFHAFCHRDPPPNPSLPDYCGCEGASFHSHNFTNTHFARLKLTHSIFERVSFTNVTFTNVSLDSCNFTNCSFENVRFGSGSVFSQVRWENSVLVDVNVTELTSCEGVVEGVRVEEGSGEDSEPGDVVRVLEGNNTSCAGREKVECEVEEEEDKVYRDLFLISFAATPGNIASAIAVYFMRRNYWMAVSMFSTTASVFLLYVAQTEIFVVVVLCLFTALSTPAWNDSNLLNSDLYPTHLRSSSQGMHLLFARIGAILGTNIFGLFIHVNPSVPILLMACLLLVGSLASLPLPKTTRKTILK